MQLHPYVNVGYTQQNGCFLFYNICVVCVSSFTENPENESETDALVKFEQDNTTSV